ncbi:MAG TPA: SDR family NAD(P)-dependent oxidoreductase [Rhizomicrobium sp.]|nr:SDR family NAD(P)-dependent oxidoreductase [Rhizomicrobium sp.]
MKHAFITGGGSGIGLATARTLAATGWRVTIAGRDAARLARAAESIPGAATCRLDVTDSAAVEAALRMPVDCLVNNAGGTASAPFEKTSLETWRAALDLNLMGAVHCTRAVLPGMKARGFGRIVNVASTAGLIGYRYVSAYVAAKHAVVGLTKALALECAKSGVTVNAVCPGYTDTEIVATAIETVAKATGRAADEARKNFTASNPQGRLVMPEEVAAAVLWLASDAASAVNGIALPVAGGEVS